jgi:hypothetical protein
MWWSSASASGLDVHLDVPPVSLAEPENAQDGSGHVPQEDRQPDVPRGEAPEPLDGDTHPDGQ